MKMTDSYNELNSTPQGELTAKKQQFQNPYNSLYSPEPLKKQISQ